MQQSIGELTVKEGSSNSTNGILGMELTTTKCNDNNQMLHTQEPFSLISFDVEETPAHAEVIIQPSPPPVLAEVQDLIPAVSPPVSEADCQLEMLQTDELVRAESPLQLHIVRFLKI